MTRAISATLAIVSEASRKSCATGLECVPDYWNVRFRRRPSDRSAAYK